MAQSQRIYGLCDAETGYYLQEARPDHVAAFEASEDGVFFDQICYGDRKLTCSTPEDAQDCG